MATYRSTLIGLTAAVSLAALTACGAATLPIGSAPTGGTKVALAKPDATGLAPLTAWPRACDLLDEGDIRAVLPAVTKVAATPGDLEMTNFNLDSARRTLVARDATCETAVWLPDVFEEDDEATTIKTAVRIVGTPAVAEDNYDSFMTFTKKPCPGVEPAKLDDCAQGGYAWSFRKGGVVVEVAASGPVMGKGARWPGQDGNRSDLVWEGQVMPELVKAIAVKLP
jgi:hypothetical protein